jgi:hypothetical protein
MKKFLFLIGAMILPSFGVAATYDCTTTNFGRGGWIPERLIFEYNDKTGAATVYDAFINYVHKKPIKAGWERRNEKSSTFRWRLEGLPYRNGGPGINTYKATLFESRNRFTMSGQRNGYDNVISGSGSCKRVK